MLQRYFDLYDDIDVPGRWELGNPVDRSGTEVGDPWVFTEGRRVEVAERLRIPEETPGRALDFSLAGFSIPVVHVKLATIFAELAPDDVQLVPVDIEGRPDQFCILVATRLVRCIDEAASGEVKLWKPEHGRQEKVGEYRSVSGMRINSSQVGRARIFRPWGWTVALVVSGEIKRAMERAGATGAKFREV